MVRASGEMLRDAKYRHEAKDQGRNSASYAAVQTSARQIPAHGIKPLLWSLSVNR
jgi:hypothetical protein